MSALSRSRSAVTVTFIAHGLVFSSWLPQIPFVKRDLGLSEGGLGLVLLAAPAGALAAMSLTGAACARWGSARITRIALGAYCLGLAGLGFGAQWLPGLVAGLASAGALVGALDVAMNAQAAATERAKGEPVMGSFHAAWSLAAGAGAGIGGLAAQYGVPLWLQLTVLGPFALVVTFPLTTAFVADAPGGGRASRAWRWERGLVLLSIVAFAALLAEGAAADWSALFLADVSGANPLVAAWGYGFFAIAMFAGRLAGDRLVGRFGHSRSVAIAAWCGGSGMSLGLLAALALAPGPGSQAAVIGGLCLLGLGIAVVVPVAFSVAGDGPGIAMVSTGGYTGWLLGPAIIGGLGEWLGLAAAMWTIPVLAILAGILAPSGLRALASRAGT